MAKTIIVAKNWIFNAHLFSGGYSKEAMENIRGAYNLMSHKVSSFQDVKDWISKNEISFNSFTPIAFLSEDGNRIFYALRVRRQYRYENDMKLYQ